ncbi:hypothetical protein Dimus_023952 [Dionaea muscipula]
MSILYICPSMTLNTNTSFELLVEFTINKNLLFFSSSSLQYFIFSDQMAPPSFTQVIESPVAPVRWFKAIVFDSHILMPKLIPDSFESVEIVEGETIAVGTVKKLNFAKGSHYKYAKHRVDEIDAVNFYYKYTTTEGDVLDGKYESVVNETKIEAAGTGSNIKLTSHFYLKEGVQINEEGIKFGQEKTKKMFKVIEEYLIANPEA